MSDPTLKYANSSTIEADPWPRICGILAIVCGASMLLIFQIPILYRMLTEGGLAGWNMIEMLLKLPPYLLRDILLILGGVALIRYKRSGYFIVIMLLVFYWAANFLYIFYSAAYYGSSLGIIQQINWMLGIDFPPRLQNLPSLLMNVSSILWGVFLLRESVRSSLKVTSGHSMGAVGLGLGLALYSLATWIIWEAIKPDPLVDYQF